MINVLQAMILTKDDQMVKTPTYYVFDMYQRHMDAQLVDGEGDVPERVTYTASKKDGELNVSLGNYDLTQDRQIVFTFSDTYRDISDASIITGNKMDAHNTFDDPNEVVEKKFTGASLKKWSISD